MISTGSAPQPKSDGEQSRERRDTAERRRPRAGNGESSPAKAVAQSGHPGMGGAAEGPETEKPNSDLE